jgi:hypothetical protein
MNTLRKLYKDFFGLREQTATTGAVKMSKAATPADIKKLTDQGVDVKLENSGIVDEAQLVNNLTDYKGGIEYVIRDPQLAQSVSDEIRQWTEKKGFTIIKHIISKTGRVGYMYFRLGEDVALDSQKLQGYLAQKPELKHFRFNVRGEQPIRPTRNPQGNI